MAPMYRPVVEVAAACGVDPTYLRRLCRMGHVEAIRVGRAWAVRWPLVWRTPPAETGPVSRLRARTTGGYPDAPQHH
jgi:hypothetical protein